MRHLAPSSYGEPSMRRLPHSRAKAKAVEQTVFASRRGVGSWVERAGASVVALSSVAVATTTNSGSGYSSAAEQQKESTSGGAIRACKGVAEAQQESDLASGTAPSVIEQEQPSVGSKAHINHPSFGEGKAQSAGDHAGQPVERHQSFEFKADTSAVMFANDLSPQRPARVFVMLPLDTVNYDGIFRYGASPWFQQALQLLAASGVYGVALDVWWGAVEREPKAYNWTGYKQVLEVIKSTGLKVQVVLSFHACGGNVGDTAQVSLPAWVLKCGESDPDIFFTDRPRDGGPGQRNREYLSIWADDAPALCGRTPMQCYEEFMASFHQHFWQDLGMSIEELVVGCGPCGELRYPSYVEGNGWRFPGIGEFQCYDRRALASLAQAAREAGHPEWGYSGPQDAGCYHSSPEETIFFRDENGGWSTPYGRFFLNWYSQSLLRHGERLLSAAYQIFGPRLHRPPRLCKHDSISNDQGSDTSTTDMTLVANTPGTAVCAPSTSAPASKASSFRVNASGDSLSAQSPGANGSLASAFCGGAPGARGGGAVLSATVTGSQYAASAAATTPRTTLQVSQSDTMLGRSGCGGGASGPPAGAEDMEIEFSDASLTSAVTMADLQALGVDGSSLGPAGSLPRNLSMWQQQCANRFKFSSSTIADEPCSSVSVGPGTGVASAGATAGISSSGAAGNGPTSVPASMVAGSTGAGLFRLEVCNSVSSFTTDYYGAASVTSSLPFADLAALLPDVDDGNDPLPVCSTPDGIPGEEGEDGQAGAAAPGFGPGRVRAAPRATSPDAPGPASASAIFEGDRDGALRRRHSQEQTVSSALSSPLCHPSASGGSGLVLAIKVAGIHWWFRTRSHAAECTAGYYNNAAPGSPGGAPGAGGRDAYLPIAELCGKYHAAMTLTCVEMCDAQHPPHAMCGPEGLLKQVRLACAKHGVPLNGENALPIFLIDGVDTTALDRIVMNTRAMNGKWYGCGMSGGAMSGSACTPGGLSLGHSSMNLGNTMNLGFVSGGAGQPPLLYHSPMMSGMTPGAMAGAVHRVLASAEGNRMAYAAQAAAAGLRPDTWSDISDPLPAMKSFTFLRLGPELLQPSYQMPFLRFMYRMQQATFLNSVY